MRDQFMHESKNGRWMITRGKFDTTACAWNIRDTFQNKRYRVKAECREWGMVIDGTHGLPDYVISMVAKCQSQHEAEMRKSNPVYAREEN